MGNKSQREIFAHNLQYYMSLREKRQIDLVRDLKVSETTASFWYNGSKYPRADRLEQIAKYLGITVADLTRDRSIALSSSAVSIPVYAYVGAGYPYFADEDIVGEEEVSAKLLQQGVYFGLKVRGDSMTPKISNGDTLIVKKQDTAESGSIVVALIGTDAVCKKLKIHEHGLSLISTNNAYDPLFFTEEEVKTLPVRILGVCVEVRSKL